MNVIDNGNNQLENAYINVLRYDVDSNSYKLVSTVKTNSEGLAVDYLVKESEFYKFYIYYPLSTLRLETSPSYIYSDTLNFQINLLETAGADFDSAYGVEYDLSFNNASNLFTFDYSDPENTLQTAKLYIYKTTTQGGRELVNSSQSTSTTGTIYATIADFNNDTAYTATAYLTFTDSDIPVETISYSVSSPEPFGQYGLFFIWILTFIFAGIGIYKPSLALILTPIPFLLGPIIGILPLIFLPIFISIEIAAFFLALWIEGRN
jgi:hypothetical protein